MKTAYAIVKCVGARHSKQIIKRMQTMNDFCPKDCPFNGYSENIPIYINGAEVKADIPTRCIHETACRMWVEKIKTNEKGEIKNV
jgi:hypothetical protein